ncbi:cellulose biosynthesis cyclic di-GMP-binding regulatory protein BcsB [Paracoccaceae bacterium Fryx2]|nr:cellulose biosynthesis cyclic di-GMP-binding regulatory protein BcsB [Paracoccaceae bacterium Fryx2]
MRRPPPPPPPPAPQRLPLIGKGAASILRLNGEQDAADLTLFLPEGLVPTELALSLRAAINVLPERSALRVIVNDVPLDPVVPQAFDGFQTVLLPAAALVPGANRLRIESALHHRIYCGPEASFALWVEVDLAASGLTLPPGLTDFRETDFPGLLIEQASRPGGLTIRAAPDADPALVQQIALRAARMVARPEVPLRVAGLWEPAGSGADLARITVLAGAAPSADLVRGGDGSLVLRVVLGAGGAVPDLAALLPPPPPAAGVPTLAPGDVVPLSALGRGDTADFGHYIRHDIAFRLPQDWLVLGPQAAELTLLYGFGEDLGTGALLLVKVNGTTVRLLPLDRQGGAVQPALPVGFKASLMQPGVNLLTFEAIIPGDPPDLPCPLREDPMLRILAASTLEVPVSPRMQFPGLETVLDRLRGTSVSGGADDPRAGLSGAALLPMVVALPSDPLPGPPATLRVLTAPEAGLLRSSDLDLGRGLLEAVLQPPVATADAPEASPDAPLIDMGWLTRRLQAMWGGVLALAHPGDPPLPDWLQGRSGRMILMQPDAEAPGDLMLVLGPTVSPGEAAGLLAAAGQVPGGPAGRLSILAEDGTWQSWRPASVPPMLLEPLRLSSIRFIVGTYASWSPLLFTIILLGLTLLSVIIAMVFVMTTRGGRKR